MGGSPSAGAVGGGASPVRGGQVVGRGREP